MYNGPPPLAPGGGAEVLPAGLLDGPDGLASSWLTNNGFSLFGPPSSPSSRQHQHNHVSTSTSDGSVHSSSSPNSIFDSHPAIHPPSDYSHPVHTTTYNNHIPPHVPATFPSKDLLKLGSHHANLSAPSSLGLPVYSSSGFDLLSILARVVSRPNPKIMIGPVDGSCSFVVSDTRRFDAPIIYASPSFYSLTKYEEHEVIGRNCRFLQAPDGNVQKGEERRFVAPEAVSLMKKSMLADKECQVSIINYRKGGEPFVNLITIIPIAGGLFNRQEEADDVVYHVGFQVDLTEQPNAILQKLRDGNYMVNYSSNVSIPSLISTASRERKSNAPFSLVMSNRLRTLISDSTFVNSIPITKSTTVALPASTATDKPEIYEGNQLLNLLLLETSPDFVHVLSLKGSFLYVAPSVRLVLGYEPDELVGKSISDYCHPADLVPLMRELKESSAIVGPTHDMPSVTPVNPAPGVPRAVDLLFRAQSKSRGYLWVECRGRLHVEPGKGRKAIILSGRVKRTPSLRWSAIAKAGGLAHSLRGTGGGRHLQRKEHIKECEREFWGILNNKGTFLVAGMAVSDVLGWGPGEMIGKVIGDFVVGGDVRHLVEEELKRTSTIDEPSVMACTMKRKDGCQVYVALVLYCTPYRGSPSPFPVICQIKALGDSSSSSDGGTLAHPLDSSVFEELDTKRGSSWQYELQQLKYANKRLEEEVGALEASHRPSHFATGLASEPQRKQSIAHESRQGYFPIMSQSYPTHLKRSWDADGPT
ncbi:hypothetical protein SERLADRAFT_491535 [Serpula lacrymans var. lacrymans S7.9]|uniref:Uncharacterized protein dst1 n=1 Tax=Serpula lacrymans var. lacrymans (strain S7.9) TaxID=578457 RepID=F8NIH9_SERL9|nr:uncharacterized protein SERLADRAFT_491535 [Serpula lacrymans var. lacrymans S7.9]EGO30080.1 hypothetical protein SERLADRAFT_491535 [Serpula lacrymans var. lacrymans S7.9]